MNRNLGKILAIMSVALLLSACGGAAASSWPATVGNEGTVYLSNGRNLYVVDAQTGVEATLPTAEGNQPARLPFNADGAVSFYAPVETKGDLLILGNAATKGFQLYAIDSKSGLVKWVFDKATVPWIAGVKVHENTIFAPSGDGNLYLIDVETGAQIGEPIKLSEHSLWTKPVSDGKNVFIENMDHEIFAFDAEGNLAWKTELDSSILGAPLVEGESLFVGTLTGNLYSLDAASGTQKWSVDLEGNIWSTPATDGTSIYIGTVIGNTGKFYSIDMETGTINWQKDEPGSIIGAPAVEQGDIYYVTEAGKLQVVTNAGAPKWQAIIENAKYYTAPLVMDGLVILAPMNSDYLLVAYDLQGAQKWTFTGK